MSSKGLRPQSWQEFYGTRIQDEEIVFYSAESGVSASEPRGSLSGSYILRALDGEYELRVNGSTAYLEDVESLLERQELNEHEVSPGEGDEYFFLEFRSETEIEDSNDYHVSMDRITDQFNADIRLFDDTEDSYYGFGFRKE